MSCDDLEAGLTRVGEQTGGTSLKARPSGTLSGVARMAGQGICRTFSFAPPVVIPSSQIVTFNVDPVLTFSGDFMQTF